MSKDSPRMTLVTDVCFVSLADIGALMELVRLLTVSRLLGAQATLEQTAWPGE
jgi:hypothetical protein